MTDKILREFERKAATGGIEEKLKYVKDCQKHGKRLKSLRESNQKVNDFYDSMLNGKVKFVDTILDYLQVFDPSRALWGFKKPHTTDVRSQIISIPKNEIKNDYKFSCNIEYPISKGKVMSLPVYYFSIIDHCEIMENARNQIIIDLVPWISYLEEIVLNDADIKSNFSYAFNQGIIRCSFRTSNLQNSYDLEVYFPSCKSDIDSKWGSLVPLYLPKDYVHDTETS